MFLAPAKRRRRQKPVGEADVELAGAVTFESGRGSKTAGRKRPRRTEVPLYKVPNEGKDSSDVDDPHHIVHTADGFADDFADDFADGFSEANTNTNMAGPSMALPGLGSGTKKVSSMI